MSPPLPSLILLLVTCIQQIVLLAISARRDFRKEQVLDKESAISPGIIAGFASALWIIWANWYVVTGLAAYRQFISGWAAVVISGFVAIGLFSGAASVAILVAVVWYYIACGTYKHGQALGRLSVRG